MLVFDRLREGQLSMGAAARRLQISYRQCARSYKRYLAEGAKGLVHRSRGRTMRPVVEAAKHKCSKSVSSPSISGADGGKNKIRSKPHPWLRNYKLMWDRAGVR